MAGGAVGNGQLTIRVLYSRLQINYGVIPNQSEDWCGNLHRHRDRVLLKMEIATEAGALARNDPKFETVFS